jgi:hypothetical protein
MLLASPDINSPVYITFQAQSAQFGNAHSGTSKASKEVIPTIGICEMITTGSRFIPNYGIGLRYLPALLVEFPKGWEDRYLGRFVQNSPQKDWFDNVFLKGITIDIVRQPKHGQVKMTDQDRGDASGVNSAVQIQWLESRARPNPSLKRSANGRPPGPGRWYSVHFHRPGPGVLPSSPA